MQLHNLLANSNFTYKLQTDLDENFNSEMYLSTRKSSLNFRSHPDLDPDLGFFNEFLPWWVSIDAIRLILLVTLEVAEKFLWNLSERGDVSQATNHLILTLIDVMIWTWKLTKSFYHSETAPISRLLHDPRVLVVLTYSKNSNTINIKFNGFQGPKYFYRLSRSMKMLLLNLISFSRTEAEPWTGWQMDRDINRPSDSSRSSESSSSSELLSIVFWNFAGPLAPAVTGIFICTESSHNVHPHSTETVQQHTHTYIRTLSSGLSWSQCSLPFTATRSSADADNRLDAFSGQSRSTNMVPFHM